MTNKHAIEHIGTAMDVINSQQWIIYADPHYNYRHDSTEDIVHFMNSDIGKAIAILSQAWFQLDELKKSLQESSKS